MHRKARKFFFAHLQADRYCVERASRHDRAPGAFEVFGRHQLQVDQPAERVVEVRHLLARQFELVGRAVQRERYAIAVDDQAARWRDRLDANPVTLRKLGEVVVAHDLQVEKPGHQRAQQHHDHERGCDYASANMRCSA